MSNFWGYRALRRAFSCLLILSLSTVTPSGTIAGTITISGHVIDANGLPLAGVKLQLSTVEGTQHFETATDVNGAYAFNGLAGGSYGLHPSFGGCQFLPHDVDLNNLTTSTTQDFNGSGKSCGGQPTVNSGATSGPLTISGHLRDGSGLAIVGGRIDLHGDARAIRFTDFTGGYTFHVNPGRYTLQASGDCPFTPSSVNEAVQANVVQDFTAGTGCVTASQSNVIGTGSVFRVRQGGNLLGRTYVDIEQRSGPSDALAELAEIVAERTAPSQSLTIAGNRAIQRQEVVTPAPPVPKGSGGPSSISFIAITTAIAVGDTVAGFESDLPINADPRHDCPLRSSGSQFHPR